MKQYFWANKKVFITGHTGFKGGWLAWLLHELGAEVHGYSLLPPTKPSFFEETAVENMIASSTIGDLLETEKLNKSLSSISPDVIFHLAAQPLVRKSYIDPFETFSINVMGTINLLDVIYKNCKNISVINVTTDKCYENREWIWPYREQDHLGGYDPYSASKACVEIATNAYRRSFLSDAGINIATARAGNVIGGGDWAQDRLIPDFQRAIAENKTLKIRSPKSIRPWQHVLEPLSGYVNLAEKLIEKGHEFAEAWNFGPNPNDFKSVGWIANKLCKSFDGFNWQAETNDEFHEANILKLDSSKAKERLGWVPLWTLENAIDKTIEWHKAWLDGIPMNEVTIGQIKSYIERARPNGI